MHAVKHLLTPGTQGYALLKMGAFAGVFGLQYAVRKRSRQSAQEQAAAEATAAPSPRRDPHPRSKKKKRRRRDHGERS